MSEATTPLQSTTTPAEIKPEIKPPQQTKLEIEEEPERPEFELPELKLLEALKGGQLTMAEAVVLINLMNQQEAERERRHERKMAELMRTKSPEENSFKERLDKLEANLNYIRGILEGRGGNKLGSEESEVVKYLKSIEEKLSKSGNEPNLLQEITKLREDLTKKDLEKIESNISLLEKQVEKLAEKVGERGGSGKLTIDDIDSLAGMIEKLRKLIPSSQEGVDYKAVAISTFGEVAKEGIRVASQLRRQEEEEEEAMEDVIERRVYGYIVDRITKEGGQARFKVADVANKLRLTEEQVRNALINIQRKGLLNLEIPKKKEKEQVETKEKEELKELKEEKEQKEESKIEKVEKIESMEEKKVEKKGKREKVKPSTTTQ